MHCTDSLDRATVQSRTTMSASGAEPSPLDRKPAAVSKPNRAEVVASAISGEPVLGPDATLRLAPEIRPNSGSHVELFSGPQAMVPFRLVQAVMQPRNNAHDQSNLRNAYLMALQLQGQAAQQAVVPRFAASLSQSLAGHHVGQATNPHEAFATNTARPYQRQLLPGQQYPAFLVPPHDHLLYGSLYMNTLLQPNSTQPFSSGQAPPLFSQTSPSHLLESRQTNNFLADTIIHSQQQIQRLLLPVGMGSSSAPVANSASILSNPTTFDTFSLRPQHMTGTTPRSTPEGEINILSLEQLLALHGARQGG
jgi:hypothetical protein